MSNDRFTIEFKARMAPALLFTLAQAQTRAHMCQQREMAEEYRRLYQGLAEQFGIPDILSKVDETRWFAACQAMTEASTFFWHVETDYRDRDGTGKVTLVIDGEEYALGPRVTGMTESTPALDAIKELVERHGGVGAVKGDDVRHWGAYVKDESPSP